MKKLRVVIANDQTLVSAAIRSFLESRMGMEVLACLRISPRTPGIIARKRPDFLFLYLPLRGYDGLGRAEKLLRTIPRLPSVLLMINNSDEYVSKALRIGVNAVLSHAAEPHELDKAVRAALRGDRYISPKLPTPRKGTPAFETLTPRQRTVLKLTAEGKRTNEVASALKLSPKTVEFHRARLMRRLGIYDVPGLVRLAARVGLVSIDR